jgi:hypothetical protein
MAENSYYYTDCRIVIGTSSGGGGGGGNHHQRLSPEERERRLESLLLPEERARRLFFRFLSPEQKKEHDIYQYITVRGSKGGIYRIACSGNATSNVTRIGGRRERRISICGFVLKKGRDYVEQPRRYCAAIYDMCRYPYYDHFLAQKIWIETDEEYFLRIART